MYPVLSADHPFFGVQFGYWSSTPNAVDPARAWAVRFDSGDIGSFGHPPYPFGSSFNVWPVRGGL